MVIIWLMMVNILIWLVVSTYPSEKIWVRQLGWLSHILWKKCLKHQPDCIMNHWCLNSSLVIYIYTYIIYIYTFHHILLEESRHRAAHGAQAGPHGPVFPRQQHAAWAKHAGQFVVAGVALRWCWFEDFGGFPCAARWRFIAAACSFHVVLGESGIFF